jgi:hypothetical protein
MPGQGQGVQVEEIPSEVHEAAQVILAGLKLMHGEVTIRAVNGEVRAVKTVREWQGGKSKIVGKENSNERRP